MAELPCLLTCEKLQKENKPARSFASSARCPWAAKEVASLIRVLTTISESPSTTTDEMPMSAAKLRALTAANASGVATEFGRGTFSAMGL